jgi:hypothetical protein
VKRAFTILELLAATALTALLMAAVLRVVATMGATRAVAAQANAADTGRAELIDLLRRDLTHATAATFARDRATLTSHLALDPATLAASHEPVSVTYELATIHDRRWLVRRQSPRNDATGSAPTWAELICPDVVSFSIRAAGGPAVVALDASERDTPKGTLPGIVTVHLERSNAPSLDQTLVLR